MPRDLHADLVTAKNKLNNEDAWLVLFDIYVSDVEVLRIVNNEAKVTFAGDDYQPFPIAFEAFEETTKGDLPYLNVSVSNADLMVSQYLETHGGLLDKKVVMKIVHESNLSTATALIETTLMIRAASVNAEAASFRLSHHPFLTSVTVPHQRFYRHRCRWKFKSTECGWAKESGGTDSDSCDKTLDGANGCIFHGGITTGDGGTAAHPDRFGGFPGVPRKRV